MVGDDKQMSPINPGLELAPTFDALKRHLGEVPNKNTFQVNASLYDVA